MDTVLMMFLVLVEGLVGMGDGLVFLVGRVVPDEPRNGGLFGERALPVDAFS